MRGLRGAPIAGGIVAVLAASTGVSAQDVAGVEVAAVTAASGVVGAAPTIGVTPSAGVATARGTVLMSRTDGPAPSARTFEGLARDLREAQRDHLWRIALWGGVNLALGLGLVAAGERRRHPTRFGFGVQSAAWGAINVGIAGWGLFLADPGALPTTLSGAISAENGYTDLLLLNLGLNVGYMGVGAALAVASGRGLRSGDSVRGHAWAVILQGAGLFALDGVAWLGSRARLEALVGLVDGAQVGLLPGPVHGAIGVAIGLPIG